MKPTYQAIARALPPTTVEQHLAFARFVAGAHSWYKHLSVVKPSPFTFFLDPNAGRALVQTAQGEARFLDITDESQRFHYNWQTTATWRARFGHWNYRGPKGTSFRVPTAAGTWETGKPKLQILLPDGVWVPIDAPLVQVGMTGLTALVHDSGDRRQPDDHADLIQDLLWTGAGGESYVGPAADAVLAQLPEAIATAVREVAPLWEERGHLDWYRPSARQSSDELAAELRQGVAEPKPAKDERELALSAVLDAERERQVNEMVKAMARFVDALQCEMAV